MRMFSSDIANEGNEELLNSRCIVTIYFHQYAEGITGANRDIKGYLKPDGTGWPYDAAAYKAAKDAGIKKYRKQGRPTPYGNIGAENYDRKVMTVREALEYSQPGYGSILWFDPLPESVN